MTVVVVMMTIVILTVIQSTQTHSWVGWPRIRSIAVHRAASVIVMVVMGVRRGRLMPHPRIKVTSGLRVVVRPHCFVLRGTTTAARMKSHVVALFTIHDTTAAAR